jgi:hypothetical protein
MFNANFIEILVITNEKNERKLRDKRKKVVKERTVRVYRRRLMTSLNNFTDSINVNEVLS